MKKFTHRLFSKLVIGSITILAQLFWLIAIVYAASEKFTYINLLIHLLSVLLALYLVNKDMKPYNKLSWIFIILWMPIIGVSCYYLLGRSELTRKTRRKMEKVNEEIIPLLKEDTDNMEALKVSSPNAYKQSRYMTDYVPCSVCKEEETNYFSSGEETFQSLIFDIKNAKSFIFLEYFIIEQGELLSEILTLLEEKVKEGVEVRIIYDDVGCINTLPSKYYKKLQKMGIKCAAFNPFRPLLSIVMNNRDHRKITVIDGMIAYTGGFNIADEYVNKKEKFGYWKDAGIRITGNAVWIFTVAFLQMWNYIVGGEEEYVKYRRASDDKRCSKGYIQPYFDSPLDHENVGQTVYLNMINQAKDYIYIFTPYLIIDSEMSTSLITAAKSGVDVRIVTPGIPDKKLVYLLTQSYYEQLIRGGVKIYQYKPGFIHAKCFVSDDEYAVVGTVNLDYRSLYLHFECGIWMYQSSAVLQVKQDALETFEKSEIVTLDFCTKRNFFIRFLQSILRLFAPLL